jgi:hypothetical protein
MKTMMIAALAVGGFLMASSAVANADSQVEGGGYATLAACQADGSGGQFTGPGADATSYYCNQADDGLFYLFLTNN